MVGVCGNTVVNMLDVTVGGRCLRQREVDLGQRYLKIEVIFDLLYLNYTR